MNKKAFTLIELLVVVLIIGILAAIALPQYQKAVEKARAMEAVVNVRAWHDAVQRYYLANGTWPSNQDHALNDIDVAIPLPKDFIYWYIPHDGYLGFNKASGHYLIIQKFKDSERTLEEGVACYGLNTDGRKLCKSLCGPLVPMIDTSGCYL